MEPKESSDRNDVETKIMNELRTVALNMAMKIIGVLLAGLLFFIVPILDWARREYPKTQDVKNIVNSATVDQTALRMIVQEEVAIPLGKKMDDMVAVQRKMQQDIDTLKTSDARQDGRIRDVEKGVRDLTEKIEKIKLNK